MYMISRDTYDNGKRSIGRGSCRRAVVPGERHVTAPMFTPARCFAYEVFSLAPRDHKPIAGVDGGARLRIEDRQTMELGEIA